MGLSTLPILVQALELAVKCEAPIFSTSCGDLGSKAGSLPLTIHDAREKIRGVLLSWFVSEMFPRLVDLHTHRWLY